MWADTIKTLSSRWHLRWGRGYSLLGAMWERQAWCQGGQGRGGLNGLLAVVWGHPVAGQGCQDWPREELELMLVIASALSWVQAGLQGMAPAGR